MSYMKDADGVRLDTIHVKQRLDADEVYEFSGAELASTEVMHTVVTSFPTATPLGIIGAAITVPVTTSPFILKYGCIARVVTTAGGGLLQLELRETLDTNTIISFSAAPITVDFLATANTSGYRIPIKGEKRMPASASGKTYFLTCFMWRDGGSSLSALIFNATDAPTTLQAIGL